MENQDIFLRNNTGSKSKAAIIDGFVVRTNEFSHLKTMLKASKTISDVQNTVIIGQRGAGKTTLMHRLSYAILDEKILSKRYLPILFSEEQYNLSDLTNLWEAIAVGIEDNFYRENVAAKIDDIIESEKEYEKKSLKVLVDLLISKEKIAILFIENINFFLKKLPEDEKKRLKRILTSDSPFRIIGSSTSYNDGTIDFGESFYKFFNIVYLDGLTQEECEKLLIKIGQQYGEEHQIKKVINNFPGRVEALRRLTGGVPRTISYLFQIFLDNENGRAIKDLYLLIDTLTLLYKSELDQLSTQQQKVIDAIARKWDAISVKEITKRTRLESKNISSILSYLEKNQLVEKVPTLTKNHLYRIKERFMNIWYLMRFGRTHDKENVIWLVRFFDAWCDESELAIRLKKHINNLKTGKYDAKAAIDMGNTFLSCENIPENLKQELIKTTNALLPKSNSILPNKLLKSAKTAKRNTLAEIEKFIKEDKIDEAAKLLDNVPVSEKGIDYYMLAITVYLKQNNRKKIIEAAQTAWKLDEQNSSAAITMGLIFETYLNNIEKAIEFYNKSLDLPHPHPYAANRLGDIYKEKKDYATAIKHHNYAVSKNVKQSLLSLAQIYFEIGELEKAEEYFRDSTKAKLDGANTALAKFLIQIKRRKEAGIALLNAVESNEKDSNVNLGRFYLMQKRPNIKKAEEQFNQAIKKGDLEGYNQLARIYVKKGEIEKAVSAYEIGVAQGNAESAHQLGHLLNRIEEFKRSDEMFNKAVELGDESIVGCWVESIYTSQRNGKKLFAKKLLEKHKPKTDNIGFDLLHAKILLWNDDVSDSLKIIKEQTKNIIEIYDNEREDAYSHRLLPGLVEYFLLLIARKDYKILLDLFDGTEDVDYKAMLKPVYYLLMEELKEEFPTEYLKAGKELTETINDLKKEVEYLRKK